MSTLVARHVSKSYLSGGKPISVLTDASLSVDEGQFVTILGPSGSGKSTLLNICGLIETLDGGELIHKNTVLNKLTQRQRTDYRRQHLGFIFQSFNLVPVMTVADNVAYPLMLLDWSEADKKQRVREVLKQVGLSDFADKKPEQLSGGQSQRVAVARALVKRPSIIIADEPTASLDAETATQVIEQMKALATEQGTACLIATHDPRLLPYSDSVLHVDHGLIVRESVTVKPVSENHITLGELS
ncbi:ABC transporter ATP-binding protein [Reinekea sp. G2M2-21]|uniref:ABC transporter ATP-binding protein n=1 Tax=Reinekea sp. G2M2-21 TaxID=2788942 RepID=UPI001E294CDE|nr:ABC transporter ATP-binding protein [Reinekea sp. G2M2-21]